MPKKLSILKMKLVIVESVFQFNAIQSDGSKRKEESQQDATEQDSKVKSQKNDQNQEIILIPRWGKVQNYKLYHLPKSLNQPISKHSYFRLPLSYNIPHPFTYQLTQKDYSFLTYIIRKYSITATAQFYQLFIEMILRNEEFYKNPKELAHFNNENLRKQIAKILNSMHINLPLQVTNNYSEFLYEMNCYWRFMRVQRGGFPIVRGYWRDKLSSKDTQRNLILFKNRYQIKTRLCKTKNVLKDLGIEKTFKQKRYRNEAKTQEKEKEKAKKQSQDACQMSLKEEIGRCVELLRVCSQQKKEFVKSINKFHHFAHNYGFYKAVIGDSSVDIKNSSSFLTVTDKTDQLQQNVKNYESDVNLVNNNDQTDDEYQTQQQLQVVKVTPRQQNAKRECPMEPFDDDNSSYDTIYEEQYSQQGQQMNRNGHKENSMQRKQEKEDCEAFERSGGVKRVKTK